MANYFNTLNLRQQLAQLGKCRFMQRAEFADGCNVLKGKKVVIVGCGAQGLNQGLNMRDSGLDISYALRKAAITEQRASWQKATDNGFAVGTYEELIPDRRSGIEPDPGQAALRCSENRDAADEAGRRAGLLPRLQRGGRGSADPRRHHSRDGGAQVPGYRSAGRV